MRKPTKMSLKQFEKTAEDKAMDRIGAKRHKMTLAQWEKSKLDEKADRAAVKKINRARGYR